ncbi:hypothetical protein TYRP_006385 [Tyrophagus putrescentiae]|nr:hypothetical protein TYRP_006385 [Tyrophagus putrescentiae]
MAMRAPIKPRVSKLVTRPRLAIKKLAILKKVVILIIKWAFLPSISLDFGNKGQGGWKISRSQSKSCRSRYSLVIILCIILSIILNRPTGKVNRV